MRRLYLYRYPAASLAVAFGERSLIGSGPLFRDQTLLRVEVVQNSPLGLKGPASIRFPSHEARAVALLAHGQGALANWRVPATEDLCPPECARWNSLVSPQDLGLTELRAVARRLAGNAPERSVQIRAGRSVVGVFGSPEVHELPLHREPWDTRLVVVGAPLSEDAPALPELHFPLEGMAATALALPYFRFKPGFTADRRDSRILRGVEPFTWLGFEELWCELEGIFAGPAQAAVGMLPSAR